MFPDKKPQKTLKQRLLDVTEYSEKQKGSAYQRRQAMLDKAEADLWAFMDREGKWVVRFLREFEVRVIFGSKTTFVGVGQDISVSFYLDSRGFRLEHAVYVRFGMRGMESTELSFPATARQLVESMPDGHQGLNDIGKWLAEELESLIRQSWRKILPKESKEP